MSRERELIKNTFILLIGKVFTQFLAFFMLPLYTYCLPTSEYGVADLVLTYITLLIPVITLQQEMAVFRYLIDARGNKEKSSEIIKTSIKSTFLRLFIFIIPYLIVTYFMHWKYAYVALACGIFMAISNLLLQIARGFGDNTKYAIGSVVAGVVTVISNVIFICLCHCGGESILISMAIANFCCSVYLFFALKIKNYCAKVKPNKILRKKMLKYSWPLVPNGISWWLINASDRTIISLILGFAENGIYAVAIKFPAILSGFLGIFIMSWTESASMHINEDDCDYFFSKVAGNSIKIFSGLGLSIIAVMPFLFDIVIGPEYREAYQYIPIAIFGVLFSCIVSIYSAIYVAKKMTKQVAMTSIIAAAINIIVDLVLINFIGLYAAVVSTAVAYFVMIIYRHFDLRKYVKIKYNVLEVLFTIIAIIIVTVLYYLNSNIAHIIGVIVALLYIIMSNYILIRKSWSKTRRIKKHETL